MILSTLIYRMCKKDKIFSCTDRHNQNKSHIIRNSWYIILYSLVGGLFIPRLPPHLVSFHCFENCNKNSGIGHGCVVASIRHICCYFLRSRSVADFSNHSSLLLLPVLYSKSNTLLLLIRHSEFIHVSFSFYPWLSSGGPLQLIQLSLYYSLGKHVL